VRAANSVSAWWISPMRRRQSSQIVRAIEWLKQHFTVPLRIEELAER